MGDEQELKTYVVTFTVEETVSACDEDEALEIADAWHGDVVNTEVREIG